MVITKEKERKSLMISFDSTHYYNTVGYLIMPRTRAASARELEKVPQGKLYFSMKTYNRSRGLQFFAPPENVYMNF